MVVKGIRDDKWKRGLQQIATTQHVSFLVTHLAEQVVDRGQNCQAWGDKPTPFANPAMFNQKQRFT
jgi:hypothetical protein